MGFHPSEARLDGQFLLVLPSGQGAHSKRGSLWPFRGSPWSATLWPMAVDNTEVDFNSRFVRRVKEAREAMGWTQAIMADSLAIPLERYKKYEHRSLLPHYLVAKFCELTGCDIHYLMTGERRSPPFLFGTPFDRRRR
jgi:hypothetical protein